MSELTDDPSDPRLTHGSDDKPAQQADAYLVLSKAQRSKGFVRPYRETYKHVGDLPTHPLRVLTADEHERYDKYGYVAFEGYERIDSSVTGRFWTQQQLDAKGCGTITRMSSALAVTYARSPAFYGSSYCVGCSMHRPVAEFVWDLDGERVGS